MQNSPHDDVRTNHFNDWQTRRFVYLEAVLLPARSADRLYFRQPESALCIAEAFKRADSSAFEPTWKAPVHRTRGCWALWMATRVAPPRRGACRTGGGSSWPPAGCSTSASASSLSHSSGKTTGMDLIALPARVAHSTDARTCGLPPHTLGLQYGLHPRVPNRLAAKKASVSPPAHGFRRPTVLKQTERLCVVAAVPVCRARCLPATYCLPSPFRVMPCSRIFPSPLSCDLQPRLLRVGHHLWHRVRLYVRLAERRLPRRAAGELKAAFRAAPNAPLAQPPVPEELAHCFSLVPGLGAATALLTSLPCSLVLRAGGL